MSCSAGALTRGVTAALLVALLGALASATSCPEDQRTYSIDAGKSSYGYISGHACEGVASLAITSQPELPSLVVPVGEWMYLFQSSPDSRSVLVPFGVSALCNGVEVCSATVRFSVVAREDVSSSYTESNAPVPTPPPTRYPACVESGAPGTLVRLSPGASYLGNLPTGTVTCQSGSSLAATIVQPAMGSAALTSAPSTWYVYSAPNTFEDVNTTMPYTIQCDGMTVCSGAVTFWIYDDVPRCPNDQIAFEIKPSMQIGSTLSTGAECSGALSGRVRSQGDSGAFVFTSGVTFSFRAPDQEDDVLVEARVYCDNVPLCDASVGFIVTNLPQPTTLPPVTEKPTPAPPTPEPTYLMCAESYNFTVPLGQELRGTLHVDVGACQITTYSVPRNTTPAGDFQVNIIGDFLYVALPYEHTEVIPVSVACVTEYRCRTTVTLTSYRELTAPPLPETTNPPTPAPVAACANVYYYQAMPSVAISSSLNGMPGQDPCAYGRRFMLLDSPRVGYLELTAIGDFMFQPTALEGPVDFTFAEYCMSKELCRGTAYIVVSKSWTLPPISTKDPSGNQSNTVTHPQITCQGTCSAMAWKTYPNPPLWDDTESAGNSRADGKPLNGISVSLRNNSLVVEVYTLIGNLGVRFPSFELLSSTIGRYFEPGDFNSSVAPTSAAFNMSCLANQGRVGMGEDVWRWEALQYGNGTGRVGSLYASGQSWYQKFGGKHVGCDTFAAPCQYAPLLTPATRQSDKFGSWTLNVLDCDATWVGSFPLTALKAQKLVTGKPVWKFVAKGRLEATLYSEVVRPRSWIEPSRSFDHHADVFNISLDLLQSIGASKAPAAAGDPPGAFSIDPELYEYRTANGDYAFGINLLFYPLVTPAMSSSVASDRHVVGFKWLRQSWSEPSTAHCSTCTGTTMECVGDGRNALPTFTEDFPTGSCPGETARVVLSKGPAMPAGACPPNAIHVLNRSGISMPLKCQKTFQNLTIRGYVPGSRGLTTDAARALSYTGMIELQLLMQNDFKSNVVLNLTTYVARLSHSSHAPPGALGVCRASSYWPVLDPLGSSLPDEPYFLSSFTPGFLCADTLGNTFGPSGWATVYLQLPGVSVSEVIINSASISFNGTSVHLLYRDPATGEYTEPPPSAGGMWWKQTHPFLAFRSLSERLVRGLPITTAPSVNRTAVSDVVFAFSFIPGAIGINTGVEVAVSATTTANGTMSTSSFRHILYANGMLTQRSLYGVPDTGTAIHNGGSESINLWAMVAFAGVSFAVVATAIVYITMDNNRPLPKWVPRGKLIKDTVIAAMPPGLRPKPKKKKRVAYTDMYHAMGTGIY